jgi:ArsR family transcriptional regulator
MQWKRQYSGETLSMKNIQENAKLASNFLKGMANETRLVILCALAEGEKNVGELEDILGIRQPTLSQQLTRLRADKLVRTRRESKQIFYSLASEEAELVLGLLYKLFCMGESAQKEQRPATAAATEAEAA